MQDNGIESFIVIPRKVASDYRNRVINKQEREVYVWLRMIANPYGIATVDLNGLTEDCFGRNVSVNFANKVLLALKSKRYIYYETRSGRRGSFEVHLGDWPLPRKDKSGVLSIKRLDKYFDVNAKVRTHVTPPPPNTSEDSASHREPSQSLAKAKYDLADLFSSPFDDLKVRGRDNDTETHTNKESDIDRSDRSYKNKFLVATYVPSNHEEQQCHDIAKALGEESMDFILASVRKYGFIMVEQAWKYCKAARQFPNARNKGAFFNAILQDFEEERRGESQTI